MKLPTNIVKEYGDVKNISDTYKIPTSTISDVFQIGEGSFKVVTAIKEYFEKKGDYYNNSIDKRKIWDYLN